MEMVNSVATWAGLILGISSTVLAIVTIVFARATDNRSDRISQQTVSSLKHIDLTVERLSQDTNGLIKAAWEKMLQQGSSDVPVGKDESVARTELEGSLAEIRSEIQAIRAEANVEVTGQALESLQATVSKLERDVIKQDAVESRDRRDPRSVGYLLKALDALSSTAVEVTRALREGGHLTRGQLRDLVNSPLGSAILELREAELIVPLRGASGNGEKPVVYWFPPQAARALETALMLSGSKNDKAATRVRQYLQDIGYPTSAGNRSGSAPLKLSESEDRGLAKSTNEKPD